MDQNDNNLSRINRYEKKRKNTTLISTLSVVLVVLLVSLIGFYIFGGNSTNQANEQTDNTQEEQGGKQGETKSESTSQVDQSSEADSEETAVQETDSVEKSDTLEKQTVDSTDTNVKEAYTANWKPIGTEQSEPHSVVIDQGTQEWNEMMEAVTVATGLDKDEMVAWWVTRGGAQEVIATVSDSAETETYRVYLHWEENQGYRPDKVEVLIENDQKYRYE